MSFIKSIIRSSHRSSLTSYISLTTIQPKFQRLKSRDRVLLIHKFYAATREFNEDSKFKAFKDKQAKMQCDDGYPVHLKGGTIDKILYHITVGACVIGLAQCFWLYYILATTTSNQLLNKGEGEEEEK